MNTTARIETTGKSNHIHVSTDTAKQIINSGKTNWLKKRDEVVRKGGGEMETYWLVLRAHLVVLLDLVVPTRATILGNWRANIKFRPRHFESQSVESPFTAK
jgi:hypothetical protein